MIAGITLGTLDAVFAVHAVLQLNAGPRDGRVAWLICVTLMRTLSHRLPKGRNHYHTQST